MAGARLVHRTYSPFGAQHAVAGSGGWLPSHYGGHLVDGDSLPMWRRLEREDSSTRKRLINLVLQGGYEARIS